MSKDYMTAYQFAKEKHGNTLDDMGKKYFDAHICQVVRILSEVTDDQDIIDAAWLHDVVEDCGVTYKELVERFGLRVANLVMEVTHEGKKDNYGRYFPRLKTRDGIIIKFADRLSNLSRMESWDWKRQNQYLKRSKFWKDGADIFNKIIGLDSK
jgi:(p)ppGpp synthase/HD superfamily hydrolase